MPKCDFNKVALWVFSCKFAAYFQNTFSKEHLWVAASALRCCGFSVRVKCFVLQSLTLAEDAVHKTHQFRERETKMITK